MLILCMRLCPAFAHDICCRQLGDRSRHIQSPDEHPRCRRRFMERRLDRLDRVSAPLMPGAKSGVLQPLPMDANCQPPHNQSLGL
jgi:hypothetical protein